MQKFYRTSGYKMREAEMLEPLRKWLKKIGWIRDDSVLVEEFPLMGRRVDLATLTSTGRSTAYELKLYKNLEAIVQATRNSFLFDRSFVVTATRPSYTTIETAKQLRIGILLLRNNQIEIVERAPRLKHSRVVSNRLNSAFRQRSIS